MPRPEGLDKLQSKSRSDQVTEANTLVEALIFVAEVTEEGGHGLLLVARALKVVREAASGEVCCGLRHPVGRSANASDPGTCEMW